MTLPRTSIAGLMRIVLGLALVFATMRALGLAGSLGYLVVLLLVVGLAIIIGLGAYLARKNVFWRGFVLVGGCYAFLSLFLWDQAHLPGPGVAGGAAPKLATTWVIDSVHEYLIPPVSAPPIGATFGSSTPSFDATYVNSYRCARQLGHALFAGFLGACAGLVLRSLSTVRRAPPNRSPAGDSRRCASDPARV